MAMTLVGKSLWHACDWIRMHAPESDDFSGHSDDEAQPPGQCPSRDWIVKTGKGMLKVGMHWQCMQHSASLAHC